MRFTTNAFSYIIQKQFYTITPNPNTASTLYTDFNITSLKIITADNITTMSCDKLLIKLEEYVNHDELIRDDPIDILTRVDQ